MVPLFCSTDGAGVHAHLQGCILSASGFLSVCVSEGKVCVSVCGNVSHPVAL